MMREQGKNGDMTTYNILAFGATGDGLTDDAAAIQRAIDACTAGGGGTVVAPAGRTYLFNPIALKAHVELHVERGATLLAGGDLAAYPPDLRSDAITEGALLETELPRRASIIAYRADNVAITGGGVIDGNGRSFVEEDLGYIYRMRGARQYLERPFTVFLIGCTNVTMRDVTVRDAAFWTVRLTGCEDVLIQGIRIDNDLKLPNNDGIDVDCSRNVRISDCHIVAGDDCICLKTCRAAVAFGPCENVTVTGCTLVSTSAALKIGNECVAPIRNVVFDACVIRSSHRGLSINLGQEGDVENVIFAHMIVETRLFHSDWWGRSEPIYIAAVPWTAETKIGHVRHVRVTNVLARSENGVCIYAWEPGGIEDVLLADVRVELDKWSAWPGGRLDIRPSPGDGLIDHPTAGFFVKNARDVTLRNCTVAWGPQPPDYFRHALETHGASNLVTENFKGKAAHPECDAAIVTD